MKKVTRLYKSLVYNFKPKIDVDKNSKNFETLDEIDCVRNHTLYFNELR